MISFEEQVKQLLAEQYCLIVEPSQSFSSSITGVLKNVGVAVEKILVAHKYDVAKQLIEEHKPQLVITEYQVGDKLGLALIEAQRALFDDVTRISIIVTSNTSDSAVAEAAEEDVDAFILKPFSGQTFTEKITEVLKSKIDPSAYLKTIQKGKEHFSLQEFTMAADRFVEAKSLNDMPTLACFYLGQTYQAQGEVGKALEAYKEGRRYQPLHYKCLIGEFEGWMEEKKYKEAYELVPIIQENYPLTSHRLGQIFTAAVFTHHFEDLHMYFKLYLNLDKRSESLTELSSIALLTAGRFFLRKGNIVKALEAFEMGTTVAGRQIAFLDKVIHDLLRYNYTTEAQSFMTKVLPSDVGSSMFYQLQFRLDALTASDDEIINRGKKLVQDGLATPEIYERLVLSLAKQNKRPLAETMISKAVEVYPKMREGLYQILDSHNKG